LRSYTLPLGSHIVKNEGDSIKAGDILVKIPRAIGKAGDITGGLPRVTELFEARNPSNPAVVSEIDGEVSFGRIKRGNQEISVTSKTGEVKKYMVPLSKQITGSRERLHPGGNAVVRRCHHPRRHPGHQGTHRRSGVTS